MTVAEKERFEVSYRTPDRDLVRRYLNQLKKTGEDAIPLWLTDNLLGIKAEVFILFNKKNKEIRIAIEDNDRLYMEYGFPEKDKYELVDKIADFVNNNPYGKNKRKRGFANKR
jgi:CRISPR/Cas system-associated exonuclease Cas4 (RecB family)